MGIDLKILRVGLVGHRDLTDSNTIDHVRNEARGYFSRWRSEYDALEIYSQLAVGADTILSESALEYGAILIEVIPFSRYEEDFTSTELEHYRTLRKHAVRIQSLPYQNRSDEAYRAAGKWIVDNVDALLAAWDKHPAHGPGGTGEIIDYAQQKDKQVFIIDADRTQPKQIRKARNPGSTKEFNDWQEVLLDKRLLEYQAILDNTSKLSDRRQTANDIFVGLNSLFLTALGLLFVSSHLTTWWTPSAFGVITLFTCGANFIWLRLLNRYKNLINVRISYLTAIEQSIEALGQFEILTVPIKLERQSLEVSIAFGVHQVEGKTQLYKNAPKVGFSQLERNLIIYFIASYIAFTLLVSLLTFLIIHHILPEFSI